MASASLLRPGTGWVDFFSVAIFEQKKNVKMIKFIGDSYRMFFMDNYPAKTSIVTILDWGWSLRVGICTCMYVYIYKYMGMVYSP